MQQAKHKRRLRKEIRYGMAIVGILCIGILGWKLIFDKESNSVPKVEDPILPSSTPTPTPTPTLPMPILTNYSNPIPDGYDVDLVESIDGYLFEREASVYYEKMVNAARDEGITIYPVSTYRSLKRQKDNYERSVQSNMDKGMNREDAQRRTERLIAYPGTSEHGLGLTVDFNETNRVFEESKAFTWLQEHAVEYGFIMRYPDGKQEYTRIEYEPWHYRYVGVEHAKIIWDEKLCLEEYVEKYYPDNTYLPVRYYEENPRD